jgi:carbamoyl-phosphate synthase large subunit
MDAPIRVMVTGVGGGGHGEQIVKALRMAKTPYEITGADMSRYSSGLVQVDRPVILPPASSEDYIETVIAVCHDHGVRALFHGSEPELLRMNEHRDELTSAGLFLPINPAEVISTCMDKVRTMEALTEAGFSVPPYLSVGSLKQLSDWDHFPAVLKPSVGGGGSAHLYLVQERSELEAFSVQLLSLFDEFIVQGYVGTPDCEFTVGVLLDMDGVLLNSIALRRSILSALSNRIKAPNRTGREELGPVLAISSGVSQGEIGRFPEVTQRCEEMALALGARGPLNIQCRLVGREPQVFEINPRFSGTTSVRAMVGYNEPDVLIRRHLLGEEIPLHFAYGSGTVMRSLAETLVASTDFPVAHP